MTQTQFQQARSDLQIIFPSNATPPATPYTLSSWIFPHHIDIAVDFAEQLAQKYQADTEVVAFAALLHDAGLAYKRVNRDPGGHETRSIEYARSVLPEYGFTDARANDVIGCIAATDPDIPPATLEQRIVRTADAMSHLLSVHYLAKTAFAADIESGLQFVTRKIETDFAKVCLDDERAYVRPIYEYYRAVCQQYHSGATIVLPK